jgi:hypothetical protein
MWTWAANNEMNNKLGILKGQPRHYIMGHQNHVEARKGREGRHFDQTFPYAYMEKFPQRGGTGVPALISRCKRSELWNPLAL